MIRVARRAAMRTGALSMFRFASTQSGHNAHCSLTIKAKEHYDRAITFWNNDQIPEAQSHFEKAISIKPSSDAHYNLGNCMYALGNPEKALESWKASTNIEKRADALVNIANVLAIHKRDFGEAIPYYEEAIGISPDDGQIHYNFGTVLDAAGRLEEAVEQYRVARKLGIEIAEKNLRNAAAKLLGQKARKENVELKDEQQ